MAVNKVKILCPKCKTVYSIDLNQNNLIGKKAARCIVCKARFFVMKQEVLNKEGKGQREVTFLKSYFEKRSGVPRRKNPDRRRDLDGEDFLLINVARDIIPIFNNQGNGIDGYISPGRRQGGTRRSGIERRQ